VILEGEDAANVSDVSDANSSAGKYGTKSYTNSTGGDVVWTASYPFVIAAALMQKMAGRWVRCLARFVSLSAPIYFSVGIQDASNAVIWQGPEMLVQTAAGDLRLRDLGSAPLPPIDLGSSAASVSLLFQFRIAVANGSTAAANLDYVQLTPIEYLRFLRCNQAAVANNATVVLDEIENYAYSETSGVRLATIATSGSPVMVVPGQAQRILVLCDEASPAQASVIGRSLAVRAWYRPRRLTV
jgi:hypothetical protein